MNDQVSYVGCKLVDKLTKLVGLFSRERFLTKRIRADVMKCNSKQCPPSGLQHGVRLTRRCDGNARHLPGRRELLRDKLRAEGDVLKHYCGLGTATGSGSWVYRTRSPS